MSRRKSQISVTPADPNLPRHQGVLFVQGVPISTKNAYKAACAKMGKSMRDDLIKHMRRTAVKMGIATAPLDYNEEDDDSGNS